MNIRALHMPCLSFPCGILGSIICRTALAAHTWTITFVGSAEACWLSPRLRASHSALFFSINCLLRTEGDSSLVGSGACICRGRE